MGNCSSNNPDSVYPNDHTSLTPAPLPLMTKHTLEQSKAITKSIDTMLQHDYDVERAVIKCLLLGAGECGKSTILKQMKILHLNGFTNAEKQNYRSLIWKNTLESIQTLCHACDSLGISYDHLEHKDLAARIKQINPNGLTSSSTTSSSFTSIDLQSIAQSITRLWQDKGIQRAYQRNNEYHLLDSAPYYLRECQRILQPHYTPIDQDILRSRVATTGIIETCFTIDKLCYKMYDVGGQRGERKKWIHCFENVTAIMFIASLSEYDQVLAEDRTRNRLKESLDLFEGIINLPWFSSSPIILFLNKNDIFSEKIQHIDPGVYFPFYTGGCNYSSGLQFIQDLYFERNANTNKMIYCHVTDATNTENIEFVWKCTKHIILEQNLTSSGLMMV